MTHRMSGLPGAYCLDCGSEFPLESAFACPDCKWDGGEQGIDNHTPCAMHALWADAMQTCPPDAEKARALNAMIRKATP